MLALEALEDGGDVRFDTQLARAPRRGSEPRALGDADAKGGVRRCADEAAGSEGEFPSAGFRGTNTVL